MKSSYFYVLFFFFSRLAALMGSRRVCLVTNNEEVSTLNVGRATYLVEPVYNGRPCTQVTLLYSQVSLYVMETNLRLGLAAVIE